MGYDEEVMHTRVNALAKIAAPGVYHPCIEDSGAQDSVTQGSGTKDSVAQDSGAHDGRFDPIHGA